ncbi:hypothetical protein CDQ91_09710 [Sphingopyxis witflariensis]|uniref:Uncharacterized protein n=1 Tax=Sphingopyxis witflariensis TaxID=173675 RepID=A0A246JXU7_9SPHN|nr:hypothetical protein CDQ91_09710 [Sphingopyxis witflariensis]
MGRWQPEGLTEGPWRTVAAPPPPPAAAVPLPIAARQGGSSCQLTTPIQTFPLRHPGLDPGSMAALAFWTPDQVRGDEG